MTLKTCTCGHVLTTKNVIQFKKSWMDKVKMLWFTCVSCKSTAVLAIDYTDDSERNLFHLPNGETVHN